MTLYDDGADDREPVNRFLINRVRPVAAVAIGMVTAPLELLFLLLAGLVAALTAAVPRTRGTVGLAVARFARRLAECERRRIGPRHGVPSAPSPDDATSRAADLRVLGFLAARILPATLAWLAAGLLAVGAILAYIVVGSFVRGDMPLPRFLGQLVVGAALLVVDLQALASAAEIDRRLVRTFLEPSARELLERRVSQLATTRAEAIAAVDAERQRIERDLHDGLQQRLIALGMALGRARRTRDVDAMRELVEQAHQDAQQAIGDLREVAWRVYPAALERADLGEVLAMMAQRSDIPVRITYRLLDRPARQIETVLYFVACEAITNAAKHSRATLITIEIGAGGPGVRMRVTDDGVGGANPLGSGLQGLARRVAALDGQFGLDSPEGGPTKLLVELPCG